MNRKNLGSEWRRWQGWISQEEQLRLTDAMLRGLKSEGRNEFTEFELQSVLQWAHKARTLEILLKRVLDGMGDSTAGP